MAFRRKPVAALAFLTLCAACRRGEPPTPPGIDAAVVALPPPTLSASAPALSASLDASAGDVPQASLPQTKDKPSASGAAFDARVKALWEAIVEDNPELALSFFFPVQAYEQVKAIPNPASDWRHRLVAAFKRDIHALHTRVVEGGATPTFHSFEVPQERARWVEPNEESNKVGYYRVYGTRLIYDAGGKPRTLDVTSLISWRGEWYVVHLSGFK
jgi:hypothetical protein